MRAVGVTSFGELPRMLDLPDPDPGPGEVLVRMRYGSINPVDWVATTGGLSSFTECRFPLVMGFDGAGRIEALGPGQHSFAVGDLVYGQFWGEVLRRGTYAEWVTIVDKPSFGALQLIPPGVDPRLAAALPTAGMTADGALERLACEDGRTLLIIGATGGVGGLATQLAAQAGVNVIATARGDAREQMTRLGATGTIDYATESLPTALARVAGGVDAVLDLVGDGGPLVEATRFLRDGGRAVSVAYGVSSELAADERINAVNYVLEDKPARLARMGERLARGTISVLIDREVSLEDAPQAVAAAQRGGARGKTLIRI